MDTPPREPSDDGRESDALLRAARLEALQRLASPMSQAPQTPQATPSAQAQSRRMAGVWPGIAGGRSRLFSGRTLAVMVSLIVVVAIGVALVAHALQAQSAVATHSPAPRYLQIAPRSDGLDCPVDIAWSPDGARIAVLGYSDHCPDWPPGAAYTSGLLLVYNANTGALAQRTALDSMVVGGGLTFDTHTQYIGYQALLWSPDGTRLALPFYAQHGLLAAPPPYIRGADPTTEPQPTTAGVLLLDATTLQRTRLFTAPYAAMITSSAAPEWNLMTGKLIQSALQLPPALGYRWDAGGALLPEDSVSVGQP
ncbi:MAG TPA: hypothetical protein VIC27_02310, partial [Ktedonobacterales bacterium]